MNDDQHRLERSLRAWMSDARPPLADRDARIHEILTALDARTPPKRGVLQRLRDRGTHQARAGGRSLLNAIALGALVAVGVVAVSSMQRSSTEPASRTEDTFIVAADGSGDFSTISAAVDAADDGDTILVRPGTYRGPIDIVRDVTLRGLGSPGEVVIAADADAVGNITPREARRLDSGTNPAAWLSEARLSFPDSPLVGSYGIRLATSDATVEGLSITGPYSTAGVVVESGSPTLQGLLLSLHEDGTDENAWWAFAFVGSSTPVLRDSQWDGYLAVRDGAAPIIEDNTILGSIVSIDGPGTTTLRGNRFLHGAAASISWHARGVIEANEFEGGFGIGIDTESDVSVVGNTIRGASEEPAILLSGAGTRAKIEGNTIVDSSYGIHLLSGTAGSVVGNVLLDNTVGVDTATSWVDLDDNSIEGGLVGIAVSGSAAPRISGNSIEDMDERGLFVDGKARPVLRQNRICGSPRNLVVVSGAELTLQDNQICEDEPAP